MGGYFIVGIVSVIVVLGVMLLSLLTLSKGYAYKHSVDPLPDDDKSYESREERNDSG